ncbi:hypothetical protein, partial [Vibrio algivorus]|uniref:hypothetical protein n=1 Tax=Vibrio algivorus TaxID=1667024 RepID=UPI001C91AA6C
VFVVFRPAQRILTSKLFFLKEEVTLKLLSIQQIDNELTVPIISKLIIDWSLSSLINLFDYHQRVPTQIDRFKLLKSVVLIESA